jgi:hypothetical protein
VRHRAEFTWRLLFTRTSPGTEDAVASALLLTSALSTCPESVTTPLVVFTSTFVSVVAFTPCASFAFTWVVICASVTWARGDCSVVHRQPKDPQTTTGLWPTLSNRKRYALFP